MTQAWNCQLQSTSGQLVCSELSDTGNWGGATFLPRYLTSVLGATHLGTDNNMVPFDALYGHISLPNVIFEWAETLAGTGLGTGDVLYTNQPSGGEHMAVVVGWGPYFTRWAQLEQFASGGDPRNWAYWCDAGYDTNGNLIRKRSIDNGQIQVDIFATADERGACDSPTNLSATRTTCCTVPYVIDHGGNYRRKDYVGPAYAAGPKPYYALFWAAPGLDPDAETNLGAATPPWSFISIPTELISFPMSSLLDPATFETREEMAP